MNSITVSHRQEYNNETGETFYGLYAVDYKMNSYNENAIMENTKTAYAMDAPYAKPEYEYTEFKNMNFISAIVGHLVAFEYEKSKYYGRLTKNTNNFIYVDIFCMDTKIRDKAYAWNIDAPQFNGHFVGDSVLYYQGDYDEYGNETDFYDITNKHNKLTYTTKRFTKSNIIDNELYIIEQV